MKNVHYSARPFYIVSRVLGTFAYSYDGSYRKGVLKLSVPGVLWFGILVGIFVSIFTGSSFVLEDVNSSSKILVLAWNTSLTISFTTMLAAKFYQMHKQTSIVGFLRKIDEIDANVGGLPQLNLSNNLIFFHTDSIDAVAARLFKATHFCDRLTVGLNDSVLFLWFHSSSNLLRGGGNRDHPVAFYGSLQLRFISHDFLCSSIHTRSHGTAISIQPA